MRTARRASTYVISLTPFDADGQLDEQAFRGHLRRMAASGIGVYVGGGGSGEGFALSLQEVRRVLQIAKEELQGKVPVRALGREPRTAQDLLEYAQIVKEVGLDAFQIYSVDPGHANIPSEREIEAYWNDVLSEVSLPSVISLHQGVHYLAPLHVVKRLVDRFDQVIGINCSSGFNYLVELIDLVGKKVEIHVSSATNALSALALGATGWLSSDANLAPRLCVSTTDFHNAGEFAKRDEAFARVMRLQVATSRYPNISFTKAALGLLGLPGGYPRRPRLPVPDEELPKIAQVLEELDILSVERLEFARR